MQGLSIFVMKYFYEKPEDWIGAGKYYRCDHPFYNSCTLFKIEGRGLAVIQERFNEKTKARWWSAVDPWLASDIYFASGFPDFFDKNAAPADENGLFPTVKVRKIMWELRLKPLKKEPWEDF